MTDYTHLVDNKDPRHTAIDETGADTWNDWMDSVNEHIARINEDIAAKERELQELRCHVYLCKLGMQQAYANHFKSPPQSANWVAPPRPPSRIEGIIYSEDQENNNDVDTLLFD